LEDPGMKIKNFTVKKLDNTKGELDLARKKWADSEFIPSDEYWLATFEMDGEKHHAGIRRGRRVDVANDIVQFNVQLNVREDAFGADTFLSEGEVADITKAVSDEFLKGEYWLK
jgi:hypothetical protein